MKTAQQYLADHNVFVLPGYIDLGAAAAAIEAAVAEARSEGDRRVEEARRAGDKYREMLVGAILRSVRRHPLETPNADRLQPDALRAAQV